MTDGGNFTIVRDYHNDCTLGILYDSNNAIICRTLELPNKNNQAEVSCIPEGTYQIQKFFSSKLGWVYSLLNVTNRSLIRIHSGNTVLDIEGCILVGNKVGILNIKGVNYTAVLNSDPTLQALYAIFGTSATLTITSNQQTKEV